MEKFFVLFCLSISVVFSTEKLRVYEDIEPQEPIYQTSVYREVAAILHEIGVRFEQWEAAHPLTDWAKEEDILKAYQSDIERIKNEDHYQTVDIVKMTPDLPKKNELRNKFLNEHTHTEDEVRFFVEGEGLFYLHVHEKVYAVLCEKGDLISIPAEYTHWFDMGKEPCFIAIRFFTDPQGWVANFTNTSIAEQFIQDGK